MFIMKTFDKNRVAKLLAAKAAEDRYYLTKYLVIQTREYGPKIIPMKLEPKFGIWDIRYSGGAEIIGVTFKG